MVFFRPWLVKRVKANSIATETNCQYKRSVRPKQRTFLSIQHSSDIDCTELWVQRVSPVLSPNFQHYLVWWNIKPVILTPLLLSRLSCMINASTGFLTHWLQRYKKCFFLLIIQWKCLFSEWQSVMRSDWVLFYYRHRRGQYCRTDWYWKITSALLSHEHWNSYLSLPGLIRNCQAARKQKEFTSLCEISYWNQSGF